MSATNYLGLNIPDKNSKGRVVTEVFEPNFTKLDQNAEVVDRDKNAIWGREYGGYIQDTIPKELNKRYIDNINGKAFICIKAGDSSVTSNTIEYFASCNVVDNLDKLQNLSKNKIFATKTSKVTYSVGVEIILTDSHNFKITIPKTCVYLITINRYRGENTPKNNIQLYVNNILIESMPLGNEKVSTIAIPLSLNTGDIITTKNLNGIGVEYAYSILEA